jgi:hypothetical protein
VNVSASLLDFEVSMVSSTICAADRPGDGMTGAACLFEGLPDQAVPPAPGGGMPRLRQPEPCQPERCQPGWQIAAIDELVARDHPVRAVWAFVGTLDLRRLARRGLARLAEGGIKPADYPADGGFT